MIILFIALFFVLFFNPNYLVNINNINLNFASNKNLVARVFTPKNTVPPYPVVILCHGINNSKENMTPLALELAKHGLAAIAFDFGGFGESYPLPTELKSVENLEINTQKDAQIILEYLKNNPTIFDINKIAILGHSLGGNTTLNIGKNNPDFAGTIMLSISNFAFFFGFFSCKIIFYISIFTFININYSPPFILNKKIRKNFRYRSKINEPFFRC